MTQAASARPLRILLSAESAQQLAPAIAQVLAGQPHVLVTAAGAPPGTDVDLALVSRDVTGLSTKHSILPATQAFHDALRSAPSLRWVQIHSAGADRPVYGELRARGVQVSTASGSNAGVVAHTALAGLLALARRFPLLMAAQNQRRWAPLLGSGLPRELEGQTAVLLGWGPIGQRLGALLVALGLRLVVVRHSAADAGPDVESVGYDALPAVLPRADWLLLCCPLTARTRGLVDGTALALLPPGAHLVNVARGEVVDEPALIDALRSGRLAGAFLDVFVHEPLSAESPLWSLDNVIVTPHSAGFSDANVARVAAMFLDNLGRWQAGQPLHNLVGGSA